MIPGNDSAIGSSFETLIGIPLKRSAGWHQQVRSTVSTRRTPVADASGALPSFGDSLECQRIDIHESTTILFVLKDHKEIIGPGR